MIGRLVKLLNKNNFLREKLLSFSIHLHNFSYKLIKKFLVKPGNIHPKHRIMNYHKFFLKYSEKSDIILDIGCGNGALTNSLSKKVNKIIGIDISEKNIQIAKERAKAGNLQFIQGDATSYDFSTLKIKKFDKIVLSNVLEHIDKRIEFLKKLHKLSDTILLRVPMENRDWLTIYKKENGYNYMLDPTHFIEYTEETLFQELNKTGWKIDNYSIQFGEFWGVIKD